MKVITARNVQQAFPKAIVHILSPHEVERKESRNGEVLKSRMPVTTHYLQPKERVIFFKERNANPFFHFMECLWMVGGRKDVKWIRRFNKSFSQFSDDGKEFHGAYGHRWRKHFGMDQLLEVGRILKNNPLDRRAVLQMWSATDDLGKEGLDFPCNTTVFFDATHGRLNMTVCCRSNDIVWGAYGANAVHMSFMQEVVAAIAGLPMGQYWQMSNNWHGYTETLDGVLGLGFWDGENAKDYDPYSRGDVEPFNIVNGDPKIWLEDLDIFLNDGPIIGFRDVFFRKVVTPIYQAWMAKEEKEDPDRFAKALEIIQQCAASDWKKACTEWLIRARDKQ